VIHDGGAAKSIFETTHLTLLAAGMSIAVASGDEVIHNRLGAVPGYPCPQSAVRPKKRPPGS
jgi:hypothetical protein